MTRADVLADIAKYPGPYMTTAFAADHQNLPRDSARQLFNSHDWRKKHLRRVPGMAREIRIYKQDYAELLTKEMEERQ
jgi:predicted adenine nucleotide alpha hydrolase (AANH) superfamily ATPase